MKEFKHAPAGHARPSRWHAGEGCGRLCLQGYHHRAYRHRGCPPSDGSAAKQGMELTVTVDGADEEKITAERQAFLTANL